MEEKCTILIADDDPDAVFLVRYAMQQEAPSWALTEAVDGAETVEKLQGQGRERSLPEMLLLDLNMPRMSGFEVLDWLGKHPERRPRRVVIMTSSSVDRDVAQARAMGADAYLIKSAELGELREQVKFLGRCLERSEDLPANMAWPKAGSW